MFDLKDKSLMGKYEFINECFQHISRASYYILAHHLDIQQRSMLPWKNYNFIKRLSEKQFNELKNIPDNQGLLYQIIEMDDSIFYTHKRLITPKNLILSQIYEVEHTTYNHAIYFLLFFPDLNYKMTYSCTYFKKPDNNEPYPIFNNFNMLQFAKNISYEDFNSYLSSRYGY